MFNNALFQIKNKKRKINDNQINISGKQPTVKTRIDNKQTNVITENKTHCFIF